MQLIPESQTVFEVEDSIEKFDLCCIKPSRSITIRTLMMRKTANDEDVIVINGIQMYPEIVEF